MIDNLIQSALRRVRRRHDGMDDAAALAELVREREEAWHREDIALRELGRRIEEGDLEATIEVIRKVRLTDGEDPPHSFILRIDGPPALGSLMRAKKRVRGLALRAIQRWRAVISYGSPSERRPARRALLRVGRALVPDARGRRTNVPASQIMWAYWREAFRWRRMRMLQGGRGSPPERVRAAWEACGLDELMAKPTRLDRNDLLYFCGFTSAGAPVRRRCRITEIARIVTARRFGITAARMANILAAPVHW